MNRTRRAFTLIELMVTILIIGVLAAILMPVLAGAVRTARRAAVGSEIQSLGTALESFRSVHGEYPPSRIMVCEDGLWNTSDTTMVPDSGGADITYGSLAQRSVAALRKFWPEMIFSTGPRTLFDGTGPTWYDFDGDGRFDPSAIPGRGRILTGDECLTFFLGGIPLDTGTPDEPELSLSGFATGKIEYGFYPGTRIPISARPLPNPFRNNLADGNAAYWGDRAKVFYEFRASRLADIDGDGLLSYHDSLGTARPFAYFRADAQGYDPNDCNLPDSGQAGTSTSVVTLRKFDVPFTVVPRVALGNTARQSVSPAPNPYTTSLAATGTTTAWHKASSYQIISAGADGLYGLGGQYLEGKPQPLPVELGATKVSPNDPEIREVEADNITNFASGTLR
jgi:prepilin-type N-terminal cleavage/methylation domain-containing protein